MTIERKFKLIKKVLQPIIVLIMLPAALMLIATPFMFDAPGSEKDLSIIIQAVSIPVFLISGVLAIFMTDRFIKKSKMTIVLLLNTLPFVFVAIFLLASFLG